MSDNPEYRHEKSENGGINNTDNDPQLEPEIESHEQNVSHLLFSKGLSSVLGPRILGPFKNSLEIISGMLWRLFIWLIMLFRLQKLSPLLWMSTSS